MLELLIGLTVVTLLIIGISVGSKFACIFSTLPVVLAMLLFINWEWGVGIWSCVLALALIWTPFFARSASEGHQNSVGGGTPRPNSVIASATRARAIASPSRPNP